MIRADLVKNNKYPKRDLVGMEVGILKVISWAGRDKYGGNHWLCICGCGENCTHTTASLIKGTVKSCGCKRLDWAITHGFSNTRMHSIYLAMLSRCYNPNNTSYPNYGGIGIVVCNEWRLNFLYFRSWALNNGYTKYLSIDRVDNNYGYFSWNCRWVTMREQARNRKTNKYFSIGEETRLFMDWCKLYNIGHPTVISRLKHGWDFETALKTPPRKIKGLNC